MVDKSMAVALRKPAWFNSKIRALNLFNITEGYKRIEIQTMWASGATVHNEPKEFCQRARALLTDIFTCCTQLFFRTQGTYIR